MAPARERVEGIRVQRRLIGIIVMALLVAACGGSAGATPTPRITLNLGSPAASGGTVIGPATQQPSRGPVSTAGPPGGASATPRANRSPAPADAPFHAAPDLEATLPATVRGAALTLESVSGTGFQGTRPHKAGLRCRFYPTRGLRCRDQRQLATAVQRAGKTMADVSIAVADDRSGGTLVEVQAIRVAGVQGMLLADAVLSVLNEDALKGGKPLDARQVSIAGRTVWAVTESNAYPLGKVRWYYPSANALYEIRKVDEEHRGPDHRRAAVVAHARPRLRSASSAAA